MPNREAILPAMPMEKVRVLNIGSAMMGLGWRRACAMYASSSIKPLAITIPAIQVSTIFSPNSSIPLENSTRLIPNNKNPPISKPRRGVVKLGMYLRAYNSPAIPIGILIKKIQCQLAQVTNTPPNTGPSTGPTRPGIVTKFSTGSNSLRG